MLNRVHPPLKVSQKVTLLIAVPLVLEFFFVAILGYTMLEAEQDRQREARTVEGLTYVNLILNDVLTTAGSMIASKAANDPRYLIEIEAVSAELDEHTNKLREIAKEGGSSSQGLNEFLAIMDDVSNTFDVSRDTIQFAYAMENIRLVGKIKSFIKRMNEAGKKAIQQQNEARRLFRENEERRAKILTWVGLAAAINFFGVAAVTFVVGRGLRKRFGVVMDNTLQIAMGREPTASLDGMDELAQLDAIMHQMSSELASTRHRERSLIDNAAQIICSLSDVYAILDVNPAIEKMLGYKPESVQGTMVQALFHPQDREEAYEHLQRSKASEAEVNFVVRMRTQGGTYRYTEWTARWSAEDKNVFCIVQDISERKEAEKLRQEVIAMVSHDLRAPLTSLNISLGMVVEGVLGQLTERGVKILTRAQNSVIALIGMINDLLDLERIESGAFQLAYQPTESKKLLQEAVDMVAAQAEQRGIRIESSGDNLIASMDSDRVQRVLVNLIGNAIKFSPPGGKIFISSFKCTVGDNKGIEFRITDQGPGIPKDKLDLVFEKFQQVGTGSEGEKKGSGLGLAIAKAIVEAHNGAIGADSREGHGTTFWFRLPDEVRTRESVRSAN